MQNSEHSSYYTLADVAAILDTAPYRITYQLTTKQVPEPRLRLGGKRVFTWADIKRLADRLGKPLPEQKGRDHDASEQ